jgi:predicted Zn-dependent protease
MKIYTILFQILLLYFSCAAHAQTAPKLLFDAEVMTWLKDIAAPLLKKADIDPNEVNIYLINSQEVNAFVTPSKDIFFNVGLILKAEQAEEVQGVLAHEIGHIKGQHYLKTLAHGSQQKVPIILGAILGVSAAAFGSAEAATALLSGGLASAQDSALRYNRTHERQADKIAAKLLNQEGFSAIGLSSFFAKLQTSNLLYSRTPPPWLVSHPLPKQRISAMLEHVKNEGFTSKKRLNPEVFRRIQAKLEAFTKPSGFILRKYSYLNTSEAVYAIALVKALEGKTQESINLLKKNSISDYSKPFQNQIIGMLYQDLSEYSKADDYFTSSIKQRNDVPLLRMNKARNDIILKNYNSAIEQLTIVSHQQPSWSTIHKQLGIAYGKKGALFESHLSLAQDASLRKNTKDIEIHLQLAQKNMEPHNEAQKQKLEELKLTMKQDENKK